MRIVFLVSEWPFCCETYDVVQQQPLERENFRQVILIVCDSVSFTLSTRIKSALIFKFKKGQAQICAPSG